MKFGFVVVLSDYGDIGHQPRYAEVREVALRAEAAGFDSIWLYDHLLYRIPGRPTIGILGVRLRARRSSRIVRWSSFDREASAFTKRSSVRYVSMERVRRSNV